ncbi:c-type cytochrome [Dyella amyloliquefaciens]|uniref:c-type cytochrome n=1 Tax=Dyella amyloliquefaciens TaxID=1770545 RepID=UPI00102E2CB0|nr:c-type cytochrome [Dyella amyloliquefaciens]
MTSAAIYGACVLSAHAAQLAEIARAAIPDTIEQRVVACTSCHGDKGLGGPDANAAPRLAGQPADYLMLQLKYFQSGQRKNDAMEYITQPLTPAYAREIAEYFAGQSMTYRPRTSSAPTDDVMRRGEQVVLLGDTSRGVPSCASCHGSRLTGRAPQIPGLTGLSYEYLRAQMVQWRSHSRAADRPYCMSVVANRMSEADVQAAAMWLAGRTPADVITGDASHADEPPLPEWCVLDTAGITP